MWKCPVCGAEAPAVTLCGQCGFDGSRDYEHYPTVFAVTNTQSIQTLQEARAKLAAGGHAVRTALQRKVSRQQQLLQLSPEAHVFLLGQQETDPQRRLAYYRGAAFMGCLPAMRLLGDLYSSGKHALYDTAQAIFWYKKLVEAGDTSRCVQLGDCCRNAESGVQGLEEALRWYALAADSQAVRKKRLTCCLELGRLYYNSGSDETDTAANDRKQALYYYEKAAEMGDITAQKTLAEYYLRAIYIQQHCKKAFFWFEQAAQQGDAPSQYELGLCFEIGRGTKPDRGKAAEWYAKAAAQGHEKAQEKMQLLTTQSGWCEKACQADDPAKKAEYLLEAAQLGSADAQCELGDCYAKGRGVSADIAKAARWYEKAAKQGNAQGLYKMGCCCLSGVGVAQNNDRAFSYFTQAADQGHAEAQYALGNCYNSGKGTAASASQAAEWYTKAARQGNVEAQLKLAERYGKENDAKAVTWYRKAAGAGNAEAQYKLGNCYYRGLCGLQKDADKAMELFRKAAGQGHKAAGKMLAGWMIP